MLEGVVLFAILWPLRKKRFFRGWMLPAYLILYAVARFIVEFFREPDPQLGYVLGPFTMGQILSLLMVITGIILMFTLSHRERLKEMTTREILSS
jgi:phosphatidylglycerol:prolipoprotein diacylglycerol transferase